MKLFWLLLLTSSALAGNLPNAARGAHPYEFVRSGNRRVNELGSKAPHLQSQFNRLKPGVPNAGEKSSLKKSNGVPPYAVLMEPLVKYSQPDPLYNDKDPVGKNKTVDVKDGDLKVKREEAKDKKQISSKSGLFLPYEDSEGSATLIRPHRRPNHHHHHHVEFPGIAYLPQEPEPIIEIIIKESNESLPTPPPPPPPPKKKKEQVQVFYVKYKKEPSPLYGEEKIIYDPPVPAVTPPTNNADHHEHEEEEEEYLQHQYQEEVTLPPKPSTTLKAIIRPDSETYHGKGIHITFGGSTPEEGDHAFGQPSPEEGGFDNDPFLNPPPRPYLPPRHHHHHRGDFEEQSAPQPSVVLPPKPKTVVVPRANSGSQLTKRNPAPFQPPTQSPQQSFDNGPAATPSRDFHRPTPPPAFQQTPQFPAQPFKSQPPKVQPTNPPAIPTPSRLNPTTRYSTLPQHLQPFPKPQQSFSFPGPRNQSPQQPIPQASEQGKQYYSINQPHLKSSFQVNSRPTSPPQYQTISNQAAQQHGFPKSQSFPQSFPPAPAFHQPPKPFPQSSQTFPQSANPFSQPSNSFPPPSNGFSQSNAFSQVPQRVVGPIIQTHQAPILPPQNTFGNRPVLPPSTQQIQQQQQIQQHQQQQHVQRQHHQQQHHHQQQIQQQQHQQQIQQQQHQIQHHQNVQNFQTRQNQNQHQQQVEQLNRLQQQQQRLQSQILNQQKYQTTFAPEIIRSVSPELPFTSHRFESKKTQTQPTPRPQFSQPVKSNDQYTLPKNVATTTPSYKKYTQTTQQPVEYVTQDPKKAEEERRKKEERKKQNIAALPDEVPEDLREQLLSSGILGNADIQILDYDKIGDIPIESLPPEALANFQAVAGSEPVPAVARPDSGPEDAEAEASEQSSVIVPPNGPAGELMEMKVVRYDPDSREGARVADQYVKEGATQLEPVVLNDSKYNRYLPLKVAGAQFPVPDVPELRGKNVTSVVVLAPVDYEFLQRHEDVVEEEGRAGRRSSHPVLEVQGVHFVAGDVLKTLVKTPTAENYKKWLEKENKTSLDKQSVVLLVIEPKTNVTNHEKEIFMYDIGTQKVSKLSGELSAQFVEVAESNSENEDLEEISDSQGGDFTVKDTSEISPVHVRTQRKAAGTKARKNKSTASPR